MYRYRSECICLSEVECPKLGVANARRIFQHCIEHRLKVTRRGGDHLQYIGSGRLLLKGFAKLIEQPRVLDSNDGLRSEVLNEFDLLVGEWPHLLAIDDNCACQFAVFNHGNSKGRSRSRKFYELGAGIAWRYVGVLRCVQDIGDLHRLFCSKCLLECRCWTWSNNRVAPPLFNKYLRSSMHCHSSKGVPLASIQDAKLSLANLGRLREHCIKDRLKVARRCADHLQYVCGGGLLLQRLAELIEQSRVLDGDDGLRGEIGNQFDLLVGERLDLLTVDDNGADQLIILEHRHSDRRSRTAELNRRSGDRVCRVVGAMRHLLR